MTPGGALLLALLLAEPGPGAAADPPSDGVAPAVRQRLGASSLTCAEGERVIAEVWPVAAPTTTPEGGLVEGSLVGLVRLLGAWTDYKGQPVKAGVYTLRYALQPADGNHLGVSAHREFLLLVRASDDMTAEVVSDREALWKLARGAAGTSHPAVMALVPTAEIAQAPSGHVVVRLQVGSLGLGVVLSGRAEAEGY
jgi:hypothetical protein